MDNIKPSDALQNQVISDRLQLLKSRLAVAKAWSKKPHEAWKKWIAEYNIDNIEDTAEIRDKVRIGYIFRKSENENSSIFDDQPDLFFKGKSGDNQVIEDVAIGAYDYLWDNQGLEEKIEDVGAYFELIGMGFMDSPWLTKTKKVVEPQPILDEMGQPVIDPNTGEPVTQIASYEVPVIDRPDASVKNPFKIHFSPETKFDYVMSSRNCPYYVEEDTWQVERVKAIFGKTVEGNERLHTGKDDTDAQIETSFEQGSDIVTDDLKRVTVYLYYGILPEDVAKGIKDKDGNVVEWEWDKEYKIYFTKNEILQTEECPYSRYPLHVLGNYGLANEFWKFGDAKHLLPLVQELEMYRSQILAHTRKMANPKPLIEMNSEVDEQAFNDPRVGKPVKYAGVAPAYLSPAQLGGEVQVGVEMVRTDLEKTGPSFDLSGGGGQSQIKSPRGIATYAEAADKTSRRKKKKVARFIKNFIIFQLYQLGTNWTPDTQETISVAGKEEAITPEILQVLSDEKLLNKLDIEIESLSVNRVQMREEATAFWDIAVGAPNIYNLQAVAKDLVQNGFNKRDADRYLVSMDQMNMQAVQGFIQQLASQNPELANAVMQYAQQPNAMALQDGAPEGMGGPQGQPGSSGQEQAPQPPTGPMPPMGQF